VRRIAFTINKQPDNEISVDLARFTTKEESIARARKPGAGLGIIRAAYPRSIGFLVEHRPLEENYSHSQIEGVNTRELCFLLAENTVVDIEPEPDLSQ
jgi:hypothetical protein